MAKRNPIAKAVTKIPPKVIPDKKKPKPARKEKHKGKSDLPK
jgi:hypothetical protein